LMLASSPGSAGLRNQNSGSDFLTYMVVLPAGRNSTQGPIFTFAAGGRVVKESGEGT
jgi:hypothetical protein